MTCSKQALLVGIAMTSRFRRVLRARELWVAIDKLKRKSQNDEEILETSVLISTTYLEERVALYWRGATFWPKLENVYTSGETKYWYCFPPHRYQ